MLGFFPASNYLKARTPFYLVYKGLKFKMSKVFVPGDVVLLDGDEAIIIKVGLTTTVFESIRDEGLIWRYVPNEKVQSLKLEKVIRTDVRETNGT